MCNMSKTSWTWASTSRAINGANSKHMYIHPKSVSINI